MLKLLVSRIGSPWHAVIAPCSACMHKVVLSGCTPMPTAQLPAAALQHGDGHGDRLSSLHGASPASNVWAHGQLTWDALHLHQRHRWDHQRGQHVGQPFSLAASYSTSQQQDTPEQLQQEVPAHGLSTDGSTGIEAPAQAGSLQADTLEAPVKKMTKAERMQLAAEEAEAEERRQRAWDEDEDADRKFANDGTGHDGSDELVIPSTLEIMGGAAASGVCLVIMHTACNAESSMTYLKWAQLHCAHPNRACKNSDDVPCMLLQHS